MTDALELSVCLRMGDVAKARDMIRSGRTGGMSGEEMLGHAAEGDLPGCARMLASEGAVDVCKLEWTRSLIETRHVSAELLACGATPPAPSTDAERALAGALLDVRSSAACMAFMASIAGAQPDAHRLLLELADLSPSGPEMLRCAINVLRQGDGAPTTARA